MTWAERILCPWTAKRSDQSILKDIDSKYSLEGLMLKLKFQYFGHLIWRTDSLEKTLMLGKIEGRRRRGWQRMRWLDGLIDSVDTDLSKLWKDGGAWCAVVHGVTKSWIAFSDKTAIIQCPGKTMRFEVERSKCLKGVDPSPLGHLRGSGALRGSESTPQPSAHVLLTWWREGWIWYSIW